MSGREETGLGIFFVTYPPIMPGDAPSPGFVFAQPKFPLGNQREYECFRHEAQEYARKNNIPEARIQELPIGA